MGKVTILHVDLFYHDDQLTDWLDAKNALDRMGQKEIIELLELEYKDTLIVKNDLNTRRDWSHWVIQRIDKAIEYQTNDNPFLQAFKESGFLNDDKYQNLSSPDKQARKDPKKKPSTQFQRLRWVVPPILEDIEDFSLSIVDKDSFLVVKKDKLSGVLTKM